MVLSLCVTSAIPIWISCLLCSWVGSCGPAQEHFAEVRCCMTFTCKVLNRGTLLVPAGPGYGLAHTEPAQKWERGRRQPRVVRVPLTAR